MPDIITVKDAVQLLKRAHYDSTDWRNNKGVYVDPLYVTQCVDGNAEGTELFLSLHRNGYEKRFRVTLSEV